MRLDIEGLHRLECLAKSTCAGDIVSLRIGASETFQELSETDFDVTKHRLGSCLEMLTSLESLSLSMNRIRGPFNESFFKRGNLGIIASVYWGPEISLCRRLFYHLVHTSMTKLTKLIIQLPLGFTTPEIHRELSLHSPQQDGKHPIVTPRQIQSFALWSDDLAEWDQWPVLFSGFDCEKTVFQNLVSLSMRNLRTDVCIRSNRARFLELKSIHLHAPAQHLPTIFDKPNDRVEDITLDTVISREGAWHSWIFRQLEECSRLRNIHVHNLGTEKLLSQSADPPPTVCGHFLDPFRCFDTTCDIADMLAYRDLLVVIRGRRGEQSMPPVTMHEEIIERYAGMETPGRA